MEKETKKTTHNASACEQYVMEELKQAKEEIKVLNHNLELAKQELRDVYDKHNSFVSLLLAVFSRDDSYVEEDNEGLASVYVLGHYIGLYNINEPYKADQRIVALAKLINRAKRIPFRY